MAGSDGFAEEAFSLPGIPSQPEAVAGIGVIQLDAQNFGPAASDYLGEFDADAINERLPPRGDRILSACRPSGADNEEACPAVLGMTPADVSFLRVRGIP